MFKVGKNSTVNADQVLEFRGLNDAGEEIKIGQIKGSIKDNKKGKSTLLNLMGEKKAYLYANKLKKKILRKIEKHGKKARDLTQTIQFILERKF